MKTLMLTAIVLLLCSMASAADLTISYGKDIWARSWTSEPVKTYALELELKAPYNKWLDIGIAAHTVQSITNPGCTIDSTYFSGTDTTLILVGRLIAHKDISKHIFIEGFGGPGLLTLDHPPEIGERDYIANCGASIGYRFDNWSLIYKVDHYSVPFYRDRGHNRHYIGIRIPFGGWGFLGIKEQ